MFPLVCQSQIGPPGSRKRVSLAGVMNAEALVQTIRVPSVTAGVSVSDRSSRISQEGVSCRPSLIPNEFDVKMSENRGDASLGKT